MQILETGIHLSKSNHTNLLPITMASLYIGSRHHQPHPTDRKESMSCIYCKGKHFLSACDVVTDQQERTAIVKHDKLCYNCLGYHNIAACNSSLNVEIVNINITLADVLAQDLNQLHLVTLRTTPKVDLKQQYCLHRQSLYQALLYKLVPVFLKQL